MENHFKGIQSVSFMGKKSHKISLFELKMKINLLFVAPKLPKMYFLVSKGSKKLA